MPMPKRSADIYDADSVLLFWKKVNRSVGYGGCWLWVGARNAKGYGVLRRGMKNILAPRFSYRIHNGQFDESLWVLHRCDNPPCVNPCHLFLGDCSVNMKDCSSKGRLVIPHPSGEAHPRSRITAEIARKIRQLRAIGLTEVRVAEIVQTTKRVVNGVSSGQTWRNV